MIDYDKLVSDLKMMAPTKEAPKPVVKIAEPTLSADQAKVVETIIRGRSVLVTGPAGTGKSTILKALVAKYGAQFPVVASTGIAAVNVGGSTIHSWAGIGLADKPADKLIHNLSNKARDRIRSAERLAIDEISMISGETLDLIDQLFRMVRKSDKPFGDMQVILFGDFLQLPPVTKTMAHMKNRFAFQSNVWREAGIGTATLRQVFRQADQEFASALNDIRTGDLSERALTMLRARFQPKDDSLPEIAAVKVHTHNIDVDQINAAELAKIEGEEKEFVSMDFGNPGPLAMLQKNCLAPEFLRLKVGAQVMLLKNIDPKAGLANGSIGKVEEFSKYGGSPIIRFGKDNRIPMEKHEWSVKDDGKVVASRTQYPLRLAWAITSHKSQGMTLDKIEVHLAKSFEYGQSYVALSRARTAPGLFIMSGSRNSIKAHPDAINFYQCAESIL